MMSHGVALLLLSAAVGYWVLERAEGQKKNLKQIGQLVGGLIIVISLLGVACKVYYLMKGGKMMYCPPGMNCPFMGRPQQQPPPASGK